VLPWSRSLEGPKQEGGLDSGEVIELVSVGSAPPGPSNGPTPSTPVGQIALASIAGLSYSYDALA
jgi:hypothetical protein